MLLSEVIKHPMDQNGFILSMTTKPKDESNRDVLDMEIDKPYEPVEKQKEK